MINSLFDNCVSDKDILDMIELHEDCKYYKNSPDGSILVDKNNEIIQNFPNYFIEHSKLILTKTTFDDSSSINIEEPVFFSYYTWGCNYQINYIELLPSVFYYAKLIKNKKILFACLGIYKDFYSYIFNILNLDVNNIISFETNTKFKNVYISKFAKSYFNGCSELSEKNILISDIIRNNLTNKFKENINIYEAKKIYINRLNKQSGFNRFIHNNDEVMNLINNIKFEIVVFEDMTIEEKYLSILNSKIVISPIGANLVNFFFSKNETIELFIMLVPKVNEHYIRFNLKQLSELGKIDENKIKILYCEVIKNGLSGDPVNNPYIVDVVKLEEMLNDYENKLKSF